MHKCAQDLISEPRPHLHPEGGYFREIFRSANKVQPLDERSAPLTDNAGGAVLLEVANEAEAKAIVANDPAMKSGVFLHEMHPWKLQPWEELAKKGKAAAQ
jgi:hypothetical protein